MEAASSRARKEKLMGTFIATYMVTTKPPAGAALACPAPEARIERETLTASAYLEIWRSVGSTLQWDQRLRMHPSDLDELLGSPACQIYILRLNGAPVGLCEFEGVGQPEVELIDFGFVPVTQRRRLGPYLLDYAIRKIWAYPTTRRIWLHTDSEDHPKAVDTYRRAGFAVYKIELEHLVD